MVQHVTLYVNRVCGTLSPSSILGGRSTSIPPISGSEKTSSPSAPCSVSFFLLIEYIMCYLRHSTDSPANQYRSTTLLWEFKFEVMQ